jgi:hypothetical protein
MVRRERRMQIERRHEVGPVISRIACLGWGSLIWNPGSLRVSGKWEDDGPLLPIEFTRISNDGRVTLIIDEEARPVRTYWSLMLVRSVNQAVQELKSREGTLASNIGVVSREDLPQARIAAIVHSWMDKKQLDAVVWTALGYRNAGVRPSIEYVINHLKALRDNSREKAEEYIRKAPKQILTLYRHEIEKEFGWYPIE